MEAVTLAGIARRVLDELLRSPYKTLEIRSARNVVALERARELGRVFLTYETYQDITIGTEGLLAELLKLESMEQRIPWEESDEREITVCRAQVRLLGLGRIVEIRKKNTILLVRVREMLPQEMDIG
ncbi:DUF473 domain-containing protein [Thermococcus sp. GR7]|uniref:DUF473 domain-containing protein n=1 Tax=unclassified Thermococcus TaxID=2627626 RepID=UPI00142FBE78|nr:MULTISPECIES: DUF473 family protein [unclassified Thermococcus]NJD98688.1 DUF473 domain-containing protein [Thermococcus sp. LS1]NJE43081.1 DUF473 domain-containing protein [Thermococcus sp. GR6]NJE46133.1 DUF473 domain-containing protein [Thermococcus sp. GR7]NJE78231.1 DUF473 domain-containing protein [Thermococcus sp. GR4]NJF22330.1 DUF473 domain-containing protein [Thermococcus sp. GR5]